ncbi:SEC-C domain-containing protein [Paenibacillus sp. ISL-20]|uniref:SEC-C domain-containing protein n=1 Tax=Paenibacillus sp. ISL-20 TaxID=2819163 RepID=UPI001BE5A113|nr:SEC-C domain-containing protein [Paenibacillus sp. ISL-20]MBT2765387.1 SEC-C domain-containing protein [Paenibacillus sp. ISL-20]
MKTLGRNERCHCGSGKKYKNCCLSLDEQTHHSQNGNQKVIPFPSTMKEPEQNRLDHRKLRNMINNELKWKSDAHRELADNLFPQLYREYQLKGSESANLLISLIMLWKDYADEVNPKFRKPGGYAGALEYLLIGILGIRLTQSELADKHQISVGTLGSAYAKIFDYLFEHTADPEEQMLAMTEWMQQQNFQSEEEMERFLNTSMQGGIKSPNLPKSDGAQAQELLRHAERERDSFKRTQLAWKAYELDPGNADAYLVIGQEADTLDEALAASQMGLKAVKEHFGPAYFAENKGYFWGLIETRPYMRLKHFYMYLLRESGDDTAAIREAEEMLELCPNDNIGVRYELLMLYLLHRDFKAAEGLFRTYSDNTAFMTYDRLVMEYLQHGISSELFGFREAAILSNAFVPAYLYGQKKLPDVRPEYIGFGDENEAIEYVATHTELWFRPEMAALVKWMRSDK